MPVALEVQSAFNALLASMPGVPPVSWPNGEFDPSGASMWLDVDHLPRETDAPFLGDTSDQDYGGIYQITVVVALDTYETQALEMASRIMAHFPRGLDVGPARVRKSSIAPGLRDGSYWRVPVSIWYRGVV